MKTGHCENRMILRRLVLLAGILLFAAGGSLLPAADGDVALLVSDHTYAYFQNAYEPYKCNDEDWNLGTMEYRRYFLGWKYVLNSVGIEPTIIDDDQVSPAGLRKFKILILANNFWLDDAETKVITEWVRRGGRLLATFGSGYAGMEGDFLKGGTNGLHELWGDPSAKVNSSFYLGNPWVKIRISNGGGPAEGFAPGDVLDYQYLANVLIQRPDNSRDINAFFLFNEIPSRRPALFKNRHSKGLVVYYAFAPEYPIAIAHDVAGHCPNDSRYLEDTASLDVYKGIAEGLEPLMRSTIEYLLNQ